MLTSVGVLLHNINNYLTLRIMIKVMFFSYLVNSLTFEEDVRTFKSYRSFWASLARRRKNPRFSLIDYNILIG